MMYSTSADTYWGFSDYQVSEKTPGELAKWVRINDFEMETGNTNISYFDSEGLETIIATKLDSKRRGKLFAGEHSVNEASVSQPKVSVTIGRSK